MTTKLFRRAAAALAVTFAAFAGTALAADPVRLLVEPASGQTSVEPGRSLDLQVVGQDGWGNRVGFGGYGVVTSVSDGRLDVIESPYRFRFVAPSRTGTVTLRAWLRERPSVAGSLTLEVGSSRWSDRLLLRGPSNADLGTSVTIEVLAVHPTGGTSRVRDQRVVATLEGPGQLQSLEPGLLRYAAPSRYEGFRAGRSARIVAALERYPQVSTSMTLAITEPAPGPSPGPAPWPQPGGATQLVLELPRGVNSLEFGQSVEVLITATDDFGRRVDLGWRRIETSATVGDLVLVEAPSRYRYTAPPRVETPWGGAVAARLRAWVKQSPDVNGEASVFLVPPRPYARLALRGPASVETGRYADYEVLGVRSDGRTDSLRGESITVSLEGPGSLQTPAPGIVRYVAPRWDLGWRYRTARVAVALERFPETRGDLSIAISGPVVVTPPSTGGASRLAFEFGHEMQGVEAGQSIDFQVLALDSSGNRVGLGWRRLEVSATDGNLVLVESPDRFRYTAPTRVDRPVAVQLRAWIRQAPQVQETTSIDVLPRRPYEWLVLRGATSVEPGRTVDVQVLGARVGGTPVVATDPSLIVSVQGPGSVTAVAPGVYRYSAPSRIDPRGGGQLARLVASLARYPTVRGESSILVVPPPPRDELLRLEFDLPRGTNAIDAGQAVEFGVLGLDESGRRVDLSERSLEVSATEGDVSLSGRPARIRYMAPSSMPSGARSVQIRAWLKSDPKVGASATLDVRTRGGPAYGALEIRGPGAVQLGTAAEFEAWHTRRDGSSEPVTDQRVLVVLDGPGAVTSTGPGRFRYAAPPAGDTRSIGRTVRFAASLERESGATGDLAVSLTRDPPSEEDAPGIVWPGGRVRLLAWRSKSAREEDWAASSLLPLPAPGRPFVSSQNWVRLRLEPQRDDVRKLELEWTVADRPGAVVRIDDSDPSGRLRLVRGRNGRTHALVETELPPGGRPLVLNLLQTTASGEVLRDEFVIQSRR